MNSDFLSFFIITAPAYPLMKWKFKLQKHFLPSSNNFFFVINVSYPLDALHFASPTSNELYSDNP